MHAEREPPEVTWPWLIFGLLMLTLVAPIYVATYGWKMGSNRNGNGNGNGNRMPVILAIVAIVAWIAAAALACYIVWIIPWPK